VGANTGAQRHVPTKVSNALQCISYETSSQLIFLNFKPGFGH